MKCNLCNSNDFNLYIPEVKDNEYAMSGKWDIVKCNNCGLIQISPMLSYNETLKYYPDNYVQYNPRNNKIIAPLYRRFVSNQGKRIEKLIGKKARILDVGCGCGEFMKILGDLYPEWEITGIEPNEYAVKMGKDLWNLNIHHGSLETVKLEKNYFDLVILTHVIEHVPSPLITLKRINELLKPGGWLFGETDNINCWDAKIQKKYWGLLHVPRHLYFFTAESITKLVEKASYDIHKILHTFNPGGWALGWQFWIEDKIFKRNTTGRTSYYPLLLLIAIPLTIIQLLFTRKSCAVSFVCKKK